MERHTAVLGRGCCRFCRRSAADFFAAFFHQMNILRLSAELATGILVDQHRPATQFPELVGEKVARDAISGGVWLVIGKAIMLYLLRQCGADPSGGEDPKRNSAKPISYPQHLTLPPPHLSSLS